MKTSFISTSKAFGTISVSMTTLMLTYHDFIIVFDEAVSIKLFKQDIAWIGTISSKSYKQLKYELILDLAFWK